MQKKEWILEGLHCSNCALKIENEINGLQGVKADINFLMKTLTIQTDTRTRMQQIRDQAKAIVGKHEPDVVLVEKESYARKAHAAKTEDLILPGAGALLFFVGLLFQFSPATEFIILLASYILLGGKILAKAVKSIRQGQVFNENFLMGIATLGAFAIGEYIEGVAVMLFYQIGEFFQEMSLNRSRRSISQLLNIRPDSATVISDGEFIPVPPDKVSVGDTIVVKPGERVPLDGIVRQGSSSLDTSALTGESIPKLVVPDNEVYSGSLNMEGLLMIQVTKPYQESTVAKILELVENAGAKKAPTEKFITRFSRIYTPIVVIVAALLAIVPPLLIVLASRFHLQAQLLLQFSGISPDMQVSFSGLLSIWVYRALVFLVVSCPCALVISVPLGFFGGIGAASKSGILVKGGNYLEALNQVETVVFDKTGTLTKGVFEVTRIQTENGFSKEEFLHLAALAESHSNHPIARSIIKAYGRHLDITRIESHREIPGYGVIITTQGRETLLGSREFLERENINVVSFTDGTAVYMAVDGVYKGYAVISDTVRKDSIQAIQQLKAKGIHTVMLTGDAKRPAQEIGLQLGMDEIIPELLPQHKVEELEKLHRRRVSKKKIAYIGDGMNDAPVLARADIGIAMGGLGSDAAIEAADVVLMTDEPAKLLEAMAIARRTTTIVWQNIILAFGVKMAVLILGAGGLAGMWEAIFADVGVALLAILNAMRLISSRPSVNGKPYIK